MPQISSRGVANGPRSPKTRSTVRMLEVCLLLAPPVLSLSQWAGLYGQQGTQEGANWAVGYQSDGSSELEITHVLNYRSRL